MSKLVDIDMISPMDTLPMDIGNTLARSVREKLYVNLEFLFYEVRSSVEKAIHKYCIATRDKAASRRVCLGEVPLIKQSEAGDDVRREIYLSIPDDEERSWDLSRPVLAYCKDFKEKEE